MQRPQVRRPARPWIGTTSNGGPLDGLLFDITGWTADEIQADMALMTELGQFGVGGRAMHDPRPGPLRLDRRHFLTVSADSPPT
ncbi:hypothetical protein ACFWVP_30545 [Streptomyces sp. NPDC058637]|uniref:hypothetical protein n=1 Tax=Streptomyces sp. NPDC058637 TaxID=3346569 RepID=UPI0036560B53